MEGSFQNLNFICGSLKGRLLKGRLVKLSIDKTDQHVICDGHESVHIFLQCPYVLSIWNSLKFKYGVGQLRNSSINLLGPREGKLKEILDQHRNASFTALPLEYLKRHELQYFLKQI